MFSRHHTQGLSAPNRFPILMTAFLAVLTLGALHPSTAQGATDPLACTGYSQPRVFLESQAWYRSLVDGIGNDYGNVHSGTCFPWKQKISGIVHFDVRYIMYDTAGKLTSVDIQIQDPGGVHLVSRLTTSHTCPAEQTCVFWISLDADTTKTSYDGRQEFRIRATVTEPDGKQGIVTNGWQAYLANGKPYQNYRSTDNFTEGRGWYTDEGYAQARLDSPVPGAFGVAPVSGIWSPHVSIKPGAGGLPVTGSYASVDSDFDADPEQMGLVLLDTASQYVGNLTLDTRRVTNGTHYLFLRADSDDSLGSANTGVIRIPFVVNN